MCALWCALLLASSPSPATLAQPHLESKILSVDGATVVDVGGVEAEVSVVERFVGPFSAVVGHRVFLRMG